MSIEGFAANWSRLIETANWEQILGLDTLLWKVNKKKGLNQWTIHKMKRKSLTSGVVPRGFRLISTWIFHSPLRPGEAR